MSFNSFVAASNSAICFSTFFVSFSTVALSSFCCSSNSLLALIIVETAWTRPIASATESASKTASIIESLWPFTWTSRACFVICTSRFWIRTFKSEISLYNLDTSDDSLFFLAVNVSICLAVSTISFSIAATFASASDIWLVNALIFWSCCWIFVSYSSANAADGNATLVNVMEHTIRADNTLFFNLLSSENPFLLSFFIIY